MLNNLKNCEVFAYAEHTAIIVPHRNLDMAVDIMQRKLNVITRRSHKNGLSINATKTKVMHIWPAHIATSDINLIFHNYECVHGNAKQWKPIESLEKVDKYKYIGVTLGDYLNGIYAYANFKRNSGRLHTT